MHNLHNCAWMTWAHDVASRSQRGLLCELGVTTADSQRAQLSQARKGCWHNIQDGADTLLRLPRAHVSSPAAQAPPPRHHLFSHMSANVAPTLGHSAPYISFSTSRMFCRVRNLVGLVSYTALIF